MMISRLAATLCGAALVAVGLAGPAQAGEWRGGDPSHDVAALKCRPGCQWTPTPGNGNADMVAEKVVYRRESIIISVRVRDLDTSKAFALGSLLAKTDLEGRYYGVLAEFSPGRAARVRIRNPHGTPVECGAATTRLAGDTIRVEVPARCLHTPDWVRWSGYTRVIFTGDVDTQGGPYEGYYDKFRTKSSTPLNKRTLEFSRRIYRGA